MISEERYCKSCKHRCHCYAPDCSNCINDVCTKCTCSEKDWPDNPAESHAF